MSFSFKTEKIEKGTIVFLHGYGANAEDLKFLAQEWQKQFDDWNFIGFNGIYELDDESFSWFDLANSNWIEGICESAKYLENAFKDYNKPLIFVGFSQGGFLASQMAIYSKLNPLCSIAFCAGIIPFTNDVKNTPIYLINNESDPVITNSWFKKSINFAKDKEINCEGVEMPCNEHTITQESFELASMHLQHTINKEQKLQ